jgi:hypothetical protein
MNSLSPVDIESLTAEIIKLARRDDQFLEDLMHDANRAVERRLPVRIPNGIRLIVHRETPHTIHVILPFTGDLDAGEHAGAQSDDVPCDENSLDSTAGTADLTGCIECQTGVVCGTGNACTTDQDCNSGACEDGNTADGCETQECETAECETQECVTSQSSCVTFDPHGCNPAPPPETDDCATEACANR